ncbi:porin [Hydrogenophaga aquatica]
MKKSLIALAVLAASGAAMAQSSVELYGRLDASLVSTSTKINGVKQYPATKTGIESSQLNTQFWGLRGTEDLGGGLKAIFKLESNFNIDNGAVDANGMFAREANVGLAGGFGSVKLGRNYTAYDSLAGATNHTWNSNINVWGTVANTGLANYAGRVNHSVIYDSPNFSGFSGSFSYAFGEDKTAALSASDNTSMQVRYANGPLLVGFGYQKQEVQNAADIKYNILGASYDFGVAKLTGSYQTGKQGATKDKDYQLGVSMPFGAYAVALGYAKSKSETAGVKLDGSGYALVGTYNLSKRTTAYVGYENTKVESAGGATTTKVSNLAVGVRHTF